MKILLLGEFSALHNNLKDGLMELGHSVKIAAYGDGFKKIPADISFESVFSSRLGSLIRTFLPLLKIRKLTGNDIVQLINPFLFYYTKFPYNIFLSKYFMDKIIKENEKFFLLAAGDDAYAWRYGRKMLRYGHYDDVLEYDLKSKSSYMESEESFLFNQAVAERSNGVIPVMYEYELGYQEFHKRLQTIPLAVNINKIEYQDNIERDIKKSA